MPKIVDREAMQDAILDASMQVYVRKGFAGATMADVARQAGLAKGTVYLYFESKEALTQALARRHFARLEGTLSSAPPCKSLDEFLALLEQTLDRTARDADGVRVFFEVFGPSFASDIFAAEVAGFFDRVGAYYGAQLQRLAANGQAAPDMDTEATGRALAAMLDGLVLHRGLFGIGAADFADLSRAFLRFARTGLSRQVAR